MKKKINVYSSLICTVLVFYTALMFILFVWGIFTALKTISDFYDNKVLWPSGPIGSWGWGNIGYIWENFYIIEYNSIGQKVMIGVFGQLVNSIIVAIGGAFVSVAGCCIIAYLTARFDCLISKVIYSVIVVVMIVPIIGSTPSALLFLHKTNLYDNWLGYCLLRFSFAEMYTLLLYSSFKGISKEYAEAANIDGASEFMIFFRIMIPMIMPALNTIILIKAIAFWNDYNTSLLYMPSHPTLSYGAYYMSMSVEGQLSHEPMKISSCLMVALPILVFFIIFRNKVMGNVTMGGIKE